MVKKKLNILFFTLLSVLFLGSFSSSYAMSKSEAFEYCRDNCGFSSLFNTSGTPSNSGWYSYDGYKNYLDSKTQDIFFVSKNNNEIASSTSASFEISFFDNLVINGDTFTVTNNSYYTADRKTVNQASYLNYYKVGNGSGVNSGTYNLSLPTYSNSFYMLFANGFIVAASFDLPLTSHFEPNHDHIVSVNNIDNVNCLLRNWSINQWQIGKTVDFIDLNSYSMYFYDEINNVEIGTLFVNNSQNTLINNGALYYSNGDLYVNSRLISHNVLYRLYIEKWLDGVQTSEEHYFIFLPRNAVVSNNQIINAGSGDFNVQDSTNNIIASQESGDEKIIAALTSSDIPSGEEPTLQDLSIPEVEDASEDFFTWLMNSILDILYNNNDSTLELPLYNTTHYIRSDIYKLNIEPLKTFIQAAWWFIVGVPVLKYIRRSIERLKGGELPATDDKSDLLGNIL